MIPHFGERPHFELDCGRCQCCARVYAARDVSGATAEKGLYALPVFGFVVPPHLHGKPLKVHGLATKSLTLSPVWDSIPGRFERSVRFFPKYQQIVVTIGGLGTYRILVP